LELASGLIMMLGLERPNDNTHVRIHSLTTYLSINRPPSIHVDYALSNSDCTRVTCIHTNTTTDLGSVAFNEMSVERTSILPQDNHPSPFAHDQESCPGGNIYKVPYLLWDSYPVHSRFGENIGYIHCSLEKTIAAWHGTWFSPRYKMKSL